jgi:hypothetical protein
MAVLNNLEIVLDNNSKLDYGNPQDLGLKFNRIVDDFQNPTKKLGDFSYTFSLPRTRNNSAVLSYPDAYGRIDIFVGTNYGCKVFNNKNLLLEGIIELTGMDSDSFKFNFYSQFTQLIDAIGSTNVQDLNIAELVTLAGSGRYEKNVINHIEAGYANSDEAAYQFPLIFYRTFFTPGSIVDEGPSNANLNNIIVEINSKRNWWYYHQFPPAFYMVRILKAIFEKAGWDIGGTWINNVDTKRIIVPYVGPQFNLFSGTTTINYNAALPKMKCIDFLKNIINTFNLYIKIDSSNKSIILEPYNIMFGGYSNPYDITRKVDLSTIKKDNTLDFEPKINFANPTNNHQVFLTNSGFSDDTNSILTDPTASGSTYNMLRGICFSGDFFLSSPPYKFSETTNDNYLNKNAGNKIINVGFEAPAMNGMLLITQTNRVGTSITGATNAIITITVPAITQQTESDNKGYTFNEDTGSTFTDNAPSTMIYSGGLNLLYYYGQVKWDGDPFSWFGGESWNGSMKDWTYINIATGGTGTIPTGRRVIIPYASPYKLCSNREMVSATERLKTLLPSISDTTSIYGEEILTYFSTWMAAGRYHNDNYEPTQYSLVLGDDSDLLFPNLYSTFHKPKYENIYRGYTLKAKMRMTEIDWNEMTIDRPILYNNELFRLVSIKNFDPFNKSADIELLKKVL